VSKNIASAPREGPGFTVDRADDGETGEEPLYFVLVVVLTFLYAKAKTASVINRRRAEVRGSFLALHRDSDNEEARAPLSKGRC
jgi:hypothetical protein